MLTNRQIDPAGSSPIVRFGGESHDGPAPRGGDGAERDRACRRGAYFVAGAGTIPMMSTTPAMAGEGVPLAEFWLAGS